MFRRRLADDLPKRATERPQAVEPDVEADVGDAAIGLAQQEHRALHSAPLQVTVRRLPEDDAECADEVRLGDIGHRGHGPDIERLGVGTVHGVACAQQTPVQILDFSAHGATLRRQGRVLRRGSDGVPLPEAVDLIPTYDALPGRFVRGFHEESTALPRF